jgi:hypothetical protein
MSQMPMFAKSYSVRILPSPPIERYRFKLGNSQLVSVVQHDWCEVPFSKKESLNSDNREPSSKIHR